MTQDFIAPLLDAVSKLRARFDGMPVTRWGVVVGLTPLRVQLDADPSALEGSPSSLVDGLSVGERVLCVLQSRRVTILGRASGAASTGDVKMTARPTAPDGWLICDGTLLSRDAFPALFAVIGFAYGATMPTNFRIPDLRGRVPVGVFTGDADFNILGQSGGTKTHSLTAPQLPAHQHWLGPNFGGNLGYGEASAGSANAYTTGFGDTRTNPVNDLVSGIQVGVTGQPHPNVQPYQTVNFIIKT